jgi:hypothetical protein
MLGAPSIEAHEEGAMRRPRGIIPIIFIAFFVILIALRIIGLI